MYCLIAVNCPLIDSIFLYDAGQFSNNLKVGDLVLVPFGKRTTQGCVVEINVSNTSIASNKIKTIGGYYSQEICLSEGELLLFRWIANYYHYSLGQHIFDCLPKIMKRPRELKFAQGLGKSLPFQLNANQQNVINSIKSKIGHGFSKWLLHGITGSGKTAVYLNLIKDILEQGKSALFLLPEINLTPQFIREFVEYLNAPIYSYHSSIGQSDKFGLWKLLQSDENPKVIIGVRSSIYLPIKNLGLIIIDEEHDQSFKQDDRCTYNARDVAIKRASLEKIPVLLGSATPAVETFHNYYQTDHYLTLPQRIGQSRLPVIEFIDLKESDFHDDALWPLDQHSIDEISKAFARHEQVLVFLNRLGYADYFQCRACGHQFSCPNCTVNLKFFRQRNEVKCQYCDYTSEIPHICPQCQNMNLLQKGFGTEKIQEVLQTLFPNHRIERFDRDAIKNFGQLEKCLDSFHHHEIDLLVGTQMLSKGHNFENVNLVLILGIDAQLNFPDFRSSERVYQLLTQVSGRSGRFGKDSKVLVLTLNRENRLFEYVSQHSFDEFYKNELPIRQLCLCPPFERIVMIYLTSKFQQRASKDAQNSQQILSMLAKKHFTSVAVMTARPALIEKRVNKYTWCLMIRSSNVNELHNILHSFEQNFKPHHSCSLKIDIDPYHFS